MIFLIDFDGTIVSQDRRYDDLKTPLEFLPFAKEALTSLRNAGHILVLWSARASHALRIDWMKNPLLRDGVLPIDRDRWGASRTLNEARYQQMLSFVSEHLPNIFSLIDDGTLPKISGIIIDDNVITPDGQRLGSPNWEAIAEMYGELEGQ